MKVCATLPTSAELVYSDAVASSNFYYEIALAAISLLLLLVTTPLLVYIEHLRARITQVRQNTVARKDRFTQTEEDDAGGVGMLRAGVLEEIQTEGKGEVQEVVDAGGGKRKKEEDQGLSLIHI